MSDEEKKIYSKEFKLEVLRQWKQGGQSARAVASSLGLGLSALYKWKEQLSEQGEEAFQGLGCRPAGPPDELTRLKKKLADTEMEREGMIACMSRKGDCWDNAVSESFFGQLKNEWTYGQDYPDRDQARTA